MYRIQKFGNAGEEYFSPSPFESYFLNNVLSDGDVENIINVAEVFKN
jgi:hypothetical protein